MFGHRQRSGVNGGKPTGRSGEKDENGKDTVFSGVKSANVSARVITKGDGKNRLIITSSENLSYAEIEIVTVGENGKSLPVKVQSVTSENASAQNGKIIITDLVADQKSLIDFTVYGRHNYAMGVKVYGN